MGAWIEIYAKVGAEILKVPSHPLWVRGLKSTKSYRCSRICYVAPFMGAWIEINELLEFNPDYIMSHPLWVRGLKFFSSLPKQC